MEKGEVIEWQPVRDAERPSQNQTSHLRGAKANLLGQGNVSCAEKKLIVRNAAPTTNDTRSVAARRIAHMISGTMRNVAGDGTRIPNIAWLIEKPLRGIKT